jgi:DNA replication complex GINS protein SLD5 C-terminus
VKKPSWSGQHLLNVTRNVCWWSDSCVEDYAVLLPLRRLEQADFNQDDLYVVRYDRIRELLRTKKVELI